MIFKMTPSYKLVFYVLILSSILRIINIKKRSAFSSRDWFCPFLETINPCFMPGFIKEVIVGSDIMTQSKTWLIVTQSNCYSSGLRGARKLHKYKIRIHAALIKRLSHVRSFVEQGYLLNYKYISSDF